MKTCLVVEDSDIVREITARIAADLGYDAQEAENAVSGLEMARDNAPDIVFLDWDLPSMGALDFLRGAATLDQRPPIILCATENDPQQFALAKSAGAAFHLLKPYDSAAVRKVLDDIEAAALVATVDTVDTVAEEADEAAEPSKNAEAGAA